jgi:hypothetical protein
MMKERKEMTNSEDGYIIAVGLSYAIAALEKLPAERQEESELDALRAMLAQLVPDKGFRQQFLSISQCVLAGNGKPSTRATFVKEAAAGI